MNSIINKLNIINDVQLEVYNIPINDNNILSLYSSIRLQKNNRIDEVYSYFSNFVIEQLDDFIINQNDYLENINQNAIGYFCTHIVPLFDKMNIEIKKYQQLYRFDSLQGNVSIYRKLYDILINLFCQHAIINIIIFDIKLIKPYLEPICKYPCHYKQILDVTFDKYFIKTIPTFEKNITNYSEADLYARKLDQFIEMELTTTNFNNKNNYNFMNDINISTYLSTIYHDNFNNNLLTTNYAFTHVKKHLHRQVTDYIGSPEDDTVLTFDTINALLKNKSKIIMFDRNIVGKSLNDKIIKKLNKYFNEHMDEYINNLHDSKYKIVDSSMSNIISKGILNFLINKIYLEQFSTIDDRMEYLISLMVCVDREKLKQQLNNYEENKSLLVDLKSININVENEYNNLNKFNDINDEKLYDLTKLKLQICESPTSDKEKIVYIANQLEIYDKILQTYYKTKYKRRDMTISYSKSIATIGYNGFDITGSLFAISILYVIDELKYPTIRNVMRKIASNNNDIEYVETFLIQMQKNGYIELKDNMYHIGNFEQDIVMTDDVKVNNNVVQLNVDNNDLPSYSKPHIMACHVVRVLKQHSEKWLNIDEIYNLLLESLTIITFTKTNVQDCCNKLVKTCDIRQKEDMYQFTLHKN